MTYFAINGPNGETINAGNELALISWLEERVKEGADPSQLHAFKNCGGQLQRMDYKLETVRPKPYTKVVLCHE